MADKYFLVDDDVWEIHSPWLSSAQNKWMSSRPWVKLVTTKEEYIECVKQSFWEEHGIKLTDNEISEIECEEVA